MATRNNGRYIDSQRRSFAARLFLIAAGLTGMAWAAAVFPRFVLERSILDVGMAVAAGETFKPEVLAAVDAQTTEELDSTVHASVLSRAALIRLRRAEDAMRIKDTEHTDERLDAASRIVDRGLENNPNDSFLWLARFWLSSARNGLSPEYFRYLQMSYDRGRYEGWVATRRNRFALAVYQVLPSNLTDTAVSEFVGLVRWGLTAEAAEIAAGPGLPLRNILFPRLRDVSAEQRSEFASIMYRTKELDDVQVPGIDPPPPPVKMPLFPPGY